jgi:predicted esterase
MKNPLPLCSRLSLVFSLTLAFFPSFSFSLAAQDSTPLPKTPEVFEVAGHKAVLYAAPTPAAGKPWLWYAPTLNGGVSLFGRKMYYEGLMRAGISLAGFDLGEVRGSPASTEKFTEFYDAMVKRGWSAKPILLGQSRGGMMMLAWAVRHPDKLRAFVGIYPVCNLASWPLKNSEAATLADFAMSRPALEAKLAEFNPIDHLKGLLENNVPMFVVHGDSDVVVPYDMNTGLLRERYEAGGGRITVKIIPGEGHKVSPSFFECRELLDFVLKQVPSA